MAYGNSSLAGTIKISKRITS